MLTECPTPGVVAAPDRPGNGHAHNRPASRRSHACSRAGKRAADGRPNNKRSLRHSNGATGQWSAPFQSRPWPTETSSGTDSG
jgi:hypothetical protein